MTPCYPVTALQEAPDPTDPCQAEDLEYGCGPRTAFRAADGSWETGYDYYTGFRGSLQLYNPYGILAMRDKNTWVMLDWRDGSERYTLDVSALDYAPSYYSDFTLQDGMGMLSAADGGPLCFNAATGEWLDASGFSEIKPFSEGLAPAVDRESGQTGYIDKAGAWVIPPRYQDGFPFRDGAALVQTGPLAWALVDRADARLAEITAPAGASCAALSPSTQPVLTGTFLMDYTLDSGVSTLCYDAALNPIPDASRVLPGGWSWYDDGTAVHLEKDGASHTLPTGWAVCAVEENLVFVRHTQWDYHTVSRAVMTLDGDWLVPWTGEDDPDYVRSAVPVWDGVSGALYLAVEREKDLLLLDREGRELAVLPLGSRLYTRMAMALDFTPDPDSGALLVCTRFELSPPMT